LNESAPSIDALIKVSIECRFELVEFVVKEKCTVVRHIQVIWQGKSSS